MSEFHAAQIEYSNYYQMLSDEIRMQAFHTAIKQIIKPGDIVVDLGAGTGILGIWALQAGAARVYTIEQTGAIDLAREIARVNGCSDRMEFIQDNSLNVSLPQRANVILSEFAAPVDNKDIYDKIDFWRRFPGVDFSPAFEIFSRKIMVESIRSGQLLAKPLRLQTVNLNTWKGASYMSRGYFPIRRAGVIHGMAGWFATTLCKDVEINTAPDQPVTHWKQAFFPFRDPIRVVQGDVLDWSVEISGKSPDSDHTMISYQYRCTQMCKEMQKKGVGRNEPCPCGSGLKFKKCCGRMDGNSCSDT